MAYIETNSAPIFASLQDVATTLWAAFMDKLVLSSKSVQIAQLTQAMNRMSDAQLTEIGITRSEVADYANMTIRVHG